MHNNFSIPASTKSFACKPSVFKYQHLTMLAVKLQPEARIFIKQIIRLLIGRLVLLISRTPPHAVAQAVLGKHQRNIFPGRQFESRVNLFHPVVLVERTGFPVGDIPQIRQAAFRERYRLGRPHTFHRLTRITGTANFQQLLHSSTAHIGEQRRGNEPVFRQTDHHLRGLERGIPQLG